VHKKSNKLLLSFYLLTTFYIKLNLFLYNMLKFKNKIKEILRDSTYNYFTDFKHPNISELKLKIKTHNLIFDKLIGGNSNILTVNYLNEDYTFECFDDDNATVKSMYYIQKIMIIIV